MKIAVIIPSFCPDRIIVKLVSELIDKDFVRVCVVNDGSGTEYDDVFDELKKLGCYVVEYDGNRGKGIALKTGLRNLVSDIPDLYGVITADGDGQHALKDILKIKEVMEEGNKSLILGVRDFSSSNIPLRSKVGNKFSGLYFKAVTKTYCPDTQTGLRGISRTLFNEFLQTEGERYEYEMNFLTLVARSDETIKFVPIDTIYNDGNTSSHFKVISDSIRIYKTPLKYISTSILSSVLDLSAFSILVSVFKSNILYGITISTVIARMISGVLNFFLNRFWSFNSRQNIGRQAFKYGILFVSQMFLSGFLVSTLSWTNNSLVILKIIVDSILFIVSYFIQINWVFHDNAKEKRIDI